MRIDKIFKVRKVAGECVIVRQGGGRVDMTRIISLNSSAEMLWNSFYGREFTEEEAAARLMEVYGISEEQAWKDAVKWADDLKKCGVMEED